MKTEASVTETSPYWFHPNLILEGHPHNQECESREQEQQSTKQEGKASTIIERICM